MQSQTSVSNNSGWDTNSCRTFGNIAQHNRIRPDLGIIADPYAPEQNSTCTNLSAIPDTGNAPWPRPYRDVLPYDDVVADDRIGVYHNTLSTVSKTQPATDNRLRNYLAIEQQQACSSTGVSHRRQDLADARHTHVD